MRGMATLTCHEGKNVIDRFDRPGALVNVTGNPRRSPHWSFVRMGGLSTSREWLTTITFECNEAKEKTSARTECVKALINRGCDRSHGCCVGRSGWSLHIH